MPLNPRVDGFWLPQDVGHRLLTNSSPFAELSFASGRPARPDDPGAVTARWPRLETAQWGGLLAALQANRLRAPTGNAFWKRLVMALQQVGHRFADPDDPLRQLALATLPAYTGYSPEMIQVALGALEMFSLESLPAAFGQAPTWAAASGWQTMPGLPGRLVFSPQPTRPWHPLAWIEQVSRREKQPIFSSIHFPDLVVGYGAGNVPGAALLISLLSQAIALASRQMPVIVVKNSRREPIFAPLVLEALEAIDPDLVCTTTILVWDYEDVPVQQGLLAQADLVMAAASDETIAVIETQARRARQQTSRPLRFHAHGHKISFAAIGKEILAQDLLDPRSGQSLLDIAALLAGLDSIFWDQHGCLSARVHFVEEGGAGYASAQHYAMALTAQLGRLAQSLPRGDWPRYPLHEQFDQLKLLEPTSQVQVFSRFDDDFLVAIDRRPLDAAVFRRLVNNCTGRVVVVRPVASLFEIPRDYLGLFPRVNLQSMSVAAGAAGQPMSESFLHFARACAKRGITAIRTVGRGAFPQLAYSWDGLMPLDLVGERPAGHFTTLEFDHPFEQMLATYQLLQRFAA